MSENGHITKELFTEDTRPDYGMSGFFHFLTAAGEVIPPWWSMAREQALSSFWKSQDHLAGTVTTLRDMMTAIPYRVTPRDTSIKSHHKQADEFNDLFQNRFISRSNPADSGWSTGYGPVMEDYFTHDNGAFIALEGPGDEILEGMPTYLIHLDSMRCMRTQNREWPVIYTDYDGKRYKIHNTRMIALSSSPSPLIDLNGVGFCSVSRCINYAQQLQDIGRYKQEKLGSRPRRAMMTVQGATPQAITNIENAMNVSASMQDAKGFTRFSEIPIVGTPLNSVVQLLDFSSMPDGFDEMTSTQLGMHVFALAFGVDMRQLSFAFNVSGQTKADAEVQHMKMRGKGPGYIIKEMQRTFGYKVLPPQLRGEFDYQDDEQDKMQAEIRGIRSERHDRDISNKVISVRVAREQMLEAGDITEAQFIDLELKDGRLENGQDIESLLYTDDSDMRRFFDMDKEEALKLAYAELNTVTNATMRYKMEMVIAVLNKKEEQLPLIAQPLIPQPIMPIDEVKSLSTYRDEIESLVIALYDQRINVLEFEMEMGDVVRRGLSQAWAIGASECGIDPDEYTEVEKSELGRLIQRQYDSLASFAASIDYSKPLNTHRIDLWVARYNEAKTKGNAYACSDQKKEWVMNRAKDNCNSCKKLNGKVKRNSFWLEMGILPNVAMAPYLDCKGLDCGCELKNTTKPLSKGPLPVLP